MSKKAFRFLIACIIVGMLVLGAFIAWGIGSDWGKIKIKDFKLYFNSWGKGTQPESKENYVTENYKFTTKGNLDEEAAVYAAPLSNVTTSDQFIIPDLYFYNEADDRTNEDGIHKYGIDIQYLCWHLNDKGTFFVSGDDDNTGRMWASILERKYIPASLEINLAFMKGGKLLGKELYGTINIPLGVYTYFFTVEGLNDGLGDIWIESYKDLENCLAAGLIQPEEVNMSDLFYTQIDLSCMLENGFCHSIDCTWSDLGIMTVSRENYYIAIREDNVLEMLTAADSDLYSITLMIDLDTLGIDTIDCISHNYCISHVNPNSPFERGWLTLREDGESGKIYVEDTSNNNGDNSDNGSGDDIGEITFPRPCGICGVMLNSLEDFNNHKCIINDNENDNPVDPVNPDNPDNPDNSDNNPDNDDNSDNNSGDKIEGNNGGGDNSGDGSVLGNKHKYHFDIRHWKIKNIKNLFKSDFWKDLFKGKVELVNPFKDPSWWKEPWFWGFVAVIILVVLLPILSIVFPPFGRIMLIVLKGIGTVLLWLLKGLWWLICLPFKGIKALIDKCRGE